MIKLNFSNCYTIAQIYEMSKLFPLDDSISAMITDSSLSGNALRFIGKIIEEYNPKNVLEFGSGVSTLFISNTLDRIGSGKLYSIEHMEKYYLETLLRLKGKCNTQCFLSPIIPFSFKFKRFLTYDPSYLTKFPENVMFDLVIIDGPPGFRFGREAPLYQIAPLLSEGALVLLDDANRAPEHEAISNWHRVWPFRIKMVSFPTLKKGLAVIQIQDPKKMAMWPFGFAEIWRSYLSTRKVVRWEKKSGQIDSSDLSSEGFRGDERLIKNVGA